MPSVQATKEFIGKIRSVMREHGAYQVWSNNYIRTRSVKCYTIGNQVKNNMLFWALEQVIYHHPEFDAQVNIHLNPENFVPDSIIVKWNKDE